MERLWTKSFVFVTVATLFLFTGFYSLYPTLPLFIKHIGGNNAEVGLATGVFMFSSVIFRPIVGGLLEIWGRRLFVVGGLILITIAMYLYSWVDGIVALMGLRVLHGMGWAFSTTANSTVIADMVPAVRRGEGMGWYGISMTFAMAVGPISGLWMIHNQSYHALFLSGVGLSIGALFLMFGAKMPFQPQSGARRIQIFEKSVLPVVTSNFLLFLAYGSVTTFVPLFAGSIKVNSGAFFLAYAAALAISRPISGRLLDRYGETFVTVPALAMTMFALIVLSFSTGLFSLLVSAVLFGIGFGSAQPALQALTIHLAHRDRIGVANASLSTATDLGIALGAILLGWLAQYTSYKALFLVSAVSVALSLGVFAYFVKRLLEHKGHRTQDAVSDSSKTS